MASGDVLASAERYDLTGSLDGQLVKICGIAATAHRDADDGGAGSVAVLVEQLLEHATRDGADLAPSSNDERVASWRTASTRCRRRRSNSRSQNRLDRAPMLLVRGGENRDLDAIAAMGRVRASLFRFHLDRDADLVTYAITRTRLLAGLAPPGVRRLEFVIAEEGITAAADIVISIVGGTGDRGVWRPRRHRRSRVRSFKR